jgi:hypothetical protein
MPVIGAGGSYDCGMRLAREIAEELHAQYESDPRYDPRPSDHDAESIKTNLGAVADAIRLVRTQNEVVEAVGLDDPALWPNADDLRGHFCAYRVLARLAREDLFSEAVTFNYDCGFEGALTDEGFLFSSRTIRGRRWHDHATVVADAKENARLEPRGALVLNKAHGCAARYRELAAQGDEKRGESIVIRWSQLLDWRRDFWARDVLSERARRHVLVLFGFSGGDPVIHIALRRVLEDVYKYASHDHPRVVVVGRNPDTVTLRMLVHAGLGSTAAPPGAVTHVSTESSSATAIALALLAELLTVRLERAVPSYTAPADSAADWLPSCCPPLRCSGGRSSSGGRRRGETSRSTSTSSKRQLMVTCRC